MHVTLVVATAIVATSTCFVRFGRYVRGPRTHRTPSKRRLSLSQRRRARRLRGCRLRGWRRRARRRHAATGLSISGGAFTYYSATPHFSAERSATSFRPGYRWELSPLRLRGPCVPEGGQPRIRTPFRSARRGVRISTWLPRCVPFRCRFRLGGSARLRIAQPRERFAFFGGVGVNL